MNDLVITRDLFELERVGDTIEVTADHVENGRVTISVDVPPCDAGAAKDYAIDRWLVLVAKLQRTENGYRYA